MIYIHDLSLEVSLLMNLIDLCKVFKELHLSGDLGRSFLVSVDFDLQSLLLIGLSLQINHVLFMQHESQ